MKSNVINAGGVSSGTLIAVARLHSLAPPLLESPKWAAAMEASIDIARAALAPYVLCAVVPLRSGGVAWRAAVVAREVSPREHAGGEYAGHSQTKQLQRKSPGVYTMGLVLSTAISTSRT